MPKFELVLLIHAHQPVGNFDDVLERAYQKSYLPFVQLLSRHPSIRMGLHYSGPLLEWIERHHPEYFYLLRSLVGKGQIEIAGGGFNEPILATIPPDDRHEQVTRLADYVEKHFTIRPRGAWLAERVWEPQLPSSLAQAGVEYTLVDDNHFLGAGFELDQLYGYYLCEELGHTVKMLPGLQRLRYLIPFREVEETTQFLRSAAEKHPGGFAIMGDDLEKFGVWPETWEHCYRDGWLERWFTEIERNGEWLTTSTPGNAIASHLPLGRADLPTASYTEMMEWSLPTPARDRYHALLEQFSARPDVMPFLRGGIWRGFFSKYSESNLMHKKMLHVSRKVRALATSHRGREFREQREEAVNLLLRGQCNDPYWHGVFGGLYSPHLRTAVWLALQRAETIADGLEHAAATYSRSETLDFDADGRDEVYFTSHRYAALVDPDDGGTISAIDFRGPHATLINSLTRRCESYHAKVRTLSTQRVEGVQTIHEATRAKEDGLARWLHYDRWPRNAFRVLVFGRQKRQADYAIVQLEEDAALAGGRYQVATSTQKRIELVSEGSSEWTVKKSLSFTPTSEGFDIVCDVRITRNAPETSVVNIGIETVLNFLAPSAPDRYFESQGERFPLRWAAETPGPEVSITDEWQRAKVTLQAPAVGSFWIAPIETVSESEDGFERVYQGSQILAVWPVELAAGAEWRGKLTLKAFESAGR